jgi:diaminohydroxyphosphoribosylaminopyrimidine deaminase/5-amino-6-(5-phosphoribosylamino)uracil reductase
VLADDPELTVRHLRGRNPVRVVLDAKLRTPRTAKLVKTAKQTRTIIFHAKSAPAAKAKPLTAAGVELVAVKESAPGRLALRDVLKALAKRDIMKLLVEGGSTVHGALLDQGLADRAAVFVAPRILGDAAGIGLASGRPRKRIAEALALTHTEVQRFGDDVLVTGDLV